MYYDRRIDEELLATLLPGGPLSWLMEHVHSSEGSKCHAHLEFRRTRNGDRKRGSVQLYWGRTSPLEFRLKSASRVWIHAGKFYRPTGSHLFDREIPISCLSMLECDLRVYLQKVKAQLANSNHRHQSLVAGEAICHAGLVRRYGHGWRSGDPLVVVDSEVQIGFFNNALRKTANDELRQLLGLSASESLPQKLDSLGVLSSGDLALVEIKDESDGIERAAVQVAAHMARYSKLTMDERLNDTVQGLLEQKRTAGVIPKECQSLVTTRRIVPWIAAPDNSPEWPANWIRAIHRCSGNLAPLLTDLKLIRLSSCGAILNEATL